MNSCGTTRCSFCLPTSATAIWPSGCTTTSITRSKWRNNSPTWSATIRLYPSICRNFTNAFSRIRMRGPQTLRTHSIGYWARVKFGLKPTLRIVHVVTMRGASSDEVAYAIAEKQLYSSHYFETALDLSLCIRGSDDSQKSGFYLIKVMASEQAGLTGLKGSIVRKVAVGKSVSSLQNSLTAIKGGLE